MQRLLLLLTLLLCAASAHARSYTAGDKPLRPGWWHDPERAGWAKFAQPASRFSLVGVFACRDASGMERTSADVGGRCAQPKKLPVPFPFEGGLNVRNT